MLGSLGELYVRGVEIDWQGFDGDYQRRKVSLPTYPFQRQRCWVEKAPERRQHSLLRPLIDKKMSIPRRQETIFEKSFSAQSLPFLADHYVYGEMVTPGACHLSLALSGAELLFDSNACVVEDVIFPQALVLGSDAERTVQLAVEAENDDGSAPFQIVSFIEADAAAAPELLHATGRLRHAAAAAPQIDLPALRARCTAQLDPADLYEKLAAAQVALGPSFRWLDAVWQGSQGEALAQLRRPDAVTDVQGYALFPSLIDACFQLVGAVHSDAASAAEQAATQLPFALQQLAFYGPTDHAELWCHVTRAAAQPVVSPENQTSNWDITLCMPDGRVAAALTGFQLRTVPASAIHGDRLRTDWLYTLEWQPQALPALSDAAHQPDSWLIVGGPDAWRVGLLPYLAAGAAQNGHKDSAPVFTLPAGADASQIQQTVAAIAEHHSAVAVIFAGFGPLPEGAAYTGAQEALLRCGVLLELCQALVATALETHLWVVTQDAQQFAGQEIVSKLAIGDGSMAVGGALWGMARTLAQEEPQLHCVCVDLDSDQSAPEQADILVQEFAAGLSHPTPVAQVAWRSGVRYVAQLQRLPAAPAGSAQAVVLRPAATYLITGGLGALGLQIAQQLVEDGARQLVLAGRRGVTTVEQQNTLDGLAASGAAVQVITADVSDGMAVQALLERCAEIGPLAGIVHAAGLLDDGVLASQTRERLANVLRPKAEGAWHLHRHTQHLDLDFFVCFSSAASLMGSAGQSNYAAANGFLDGLMLERRRQGLPGMSINWGPWAEVGLAAQRREKMQSMPMDMIPPRQGRLLFDYLLAHDYGQVGVLPLTVSPAAHQGQPVQRTLRSMLAQVPARKHHAEIVQWLRGQVAVALGFAAPEAISLQQPFFELGIDSLMALQLRNRLAAGLERPLPSTLVFEYPTIARLTGWILEQLYPASHNTALPEPLSAQQNDSDSTAKIEQLAQLSEEEAEVLLMEKLSRL